MRVAPGTWRYAAPAVLAAALGLFVSPAVAAAALGLGAFVVWFRRDPERTPPAAGAVSPADGRVSVLREEDGRLRVGVFMNVWNVHVNRAPLEGTVQSVEHHAGAHRPAFSKESSRNERVHIAFDGWEVILIAGAFARRITPYVEPGARVDRGDRIGHIAFGSRVDVVLPPSVGRDDLRVTVGDRVRAGETVIASR